MHPGVEPKKVFEKFSSYLQMNFQKQWMVYICLNYH
jgi:hypothetical protein